MPKISEVLSILGIDKKKLSKIYTELFDKKLTGQISQANMIILQKHLSSNEEKNVKKTKKKDNDLKDKKNTKEKQSITTKAIKAGDLNSDSFLSGLGFSVKKEKDIEDVYESNDNHANRKEKIVDNLDKTERISSDSKRNLFVEYGQKKSNGTTIVKKNKIQLSDKKQEYGEVKKKHSLKKFSIKKKKDFDNKISEGVRYFDTDSGEKIKIKSKYSIQNSISKVSEVKQELREKQKKIKKEAKTSSTLVKKSEIIIGSTINVKEFSEKMGVPFAEVIKKLLANKIIAGINTSIDYDTAALIALEFDIVAKKETIGISQEHFLGDNLQSILEVDKDYENLQERAPVVTIMGHVDHGKTSLLDYIRKTAVVKGEIGGITQSIGASSILHDGKKITFIDTPGHELFTAIRARGVKITNIVVIVVAADDGIKQQTIEAINHAKEANVSIIVAITKIDKPNIDIEKIKTQLTEYGLIPDERGGEVPVIPLSAVTGEGIDLLLAAILLKAHELNLKYNPNRDAVCVVLESNRDSKQGVTTSLIVMTGTLKIGDIFAVHNTYGKIRKITDRKGNSIKEAQGGEPVMVLGIPDIVEPGRIGEVVKNEKIASTKVQQIKQDISYHNTSNILANFLEKTQQGGISQLKIILKAGLWGSLEAVRQAMGNIVPPENVEIKIVHSDVGNFSESDLSLAQASKAILIGFGTSVNSIIKKKSEQLKIIIKTFDIIYELIDYTESLVNGMIKTELKEIFIGRLSVLGIFFKREKEMIIGGKVIEGKISNGANFKVYRNSEMITTGKILSLKRENDNVEEVSQGYECGMKVKVGKKILEGDQLEFFRLE